MFNDSLSFPNLGPRAHGSARRFFTGLTGSAAALGALAGCGGDDGGGAAEAEAGPGTGFLSDAGDMLMGGDGNDMLTNSWKVSVIEAGGGDDTIFGATVAEAIRAGTGDDIVDGGDGDDMIDGGAGDDMITGGAGNDRMFGGVVGGGDAGGFDTAVYEDVWTGYRVSGARAEGEWAVFTVLDMEVGVDGVDEGRDELTGFEAIQFGADSYMVVESGTDAGEILIGSAQGDDGSEWAAFDGGMGDDIIFGFGGEDVIAGGAGGDFIVGGEGDDTLYGHSAESNGSDADGVVDTAVFEGSPSGYLITAEMGDFGSRGMIRNSVRITALDIDTDGSAADGGRDTLMGFEALRFDGSESSTTLGVTRFASETGEILLGTEGADGTVADPLDGKGGDDLIFGFSGDDVIAGGAGSDIISGGAGSDTISGGFGDDTLYGHAADGGGADSGAADTATYADVRAGYGVSAGLDGVDGVTFTVRDVATAPGDEGVDILIGFEALRFDGGASPTTFLVTRAASDDGEIFLGTDGDDGAETAFDGLGGADTIFGFAGNDVIDGGAGDDIITGGAGDDVIDGGEHDSADTASYLGRYNGGAVSDYLFQTRRIHENGIVVNQLVVTDIGANDRADDMVDEGVDTLRGIEFLNFADQRGVAVSTVMATLVEITGDGIDNTLAGDSDGQRISGGGGGDRIVGGGGDDVIDGGEGEDTAVFEGVRGGHSVTLELDGEGAGSIEVRDGSGGAATLRNVELVEFADVTLEVSDTEDGTDANDIVFGSGWNDMVSGGGGDDLIFGFGGEDVIVGGAGDDVIDGGFGVDTAVFTGALRDFEFTLVDGALAVRDARSADGLDEGRDILTNVESLRFGTVDLAVSDIRFGTGNDGETDGDSTRIGIHYGKGGGHAFGGTSGIDIFQFLTAMDSADARKTTIEGFDGSGGDRIALADIDDLRGIVAETVMDDDATITRLGHVASGFELDVLGDHPDILDHVYLIGNEPTGEPPVDPEEMGNDDPPVDPEEMGNDEPPVDPEEMGNEEPPEDSDAAGSVITGSDGDDVIQGGGGDDTLYGENATDGVALGTDNDTVVYDDDFEGYHISAEWISLGGVETARFIVLDIRGAEADDEGEDTAVGFEVFRFGDGDRRVVSPGGATGDGEIIVGTNAGETIDGGGGDDLIFGFGGSDLLIGGAGDDMLIVEGVGDTLDGGGDRDIAVFLEGRNDYTVTEIRLADGGVGHEVGYADGRENGGTVTLTDIEVFRFLGDNPATPDDDAVGTSSLLVDIIRLATDSGTVEAGDHARAIVGGEGADTITGGAGTQSIIGGGGADTLAGGEGDDVIQGGEANDTLFGGSAVSGVAIGTDRDTIVFEGDFEGFHVSAEWISLGGEMTAWFTVLDILGAGSEDEGEDTAVGFEVFRFGDGDRSVVTAGQGSGSAEIIVGTNAGENIDGWDGDDLIFGFGGGDTLSGGAGDDILMGGGGGDTLDGGDDRDIAVFAGVRNDYTITEILLPGGGAEFEVGHADGRENGGTDELMNVEVLRFLGDDPANPDDDTVGTTSLRADMIRGSADSDIIETGDRAHTISGGAGADTITGGSGSQTITGGEGTDAVAGGAGDDVIQGGVDNDTLYGGSDANGVEIGTDNDTVVYLDNFVGYHISADWIPVGGVETARFTVLDIRGAGADNEGEDTVVGFEVFRFGDGDRRVVTAGGATGAGEIIVGTKLGDIIDGGAGGDLIFGFGGGDALTGGAGDDMLIVGGAGDTLDGGGDRDIAVFDGVRNDYTIKQIHLDRGGFAHEVGFANGRENGGTVTLTNIEVLRFLGDNPAIPDDDVVGTFSLEVDIEMGSANPDIIEAGDRTHTISGGTGADRITGGTGTQTIIGGGGTDTVEGGAGDDVIQGGGGDDRLYGGNAANGVAIGTDSDTVVHADNFDGYHISANLVSLGGSETAQFTVLDIRGAGADNEGEDTVVGFEVFRFRDGDRGVVTAGGRTGANDIIVGTNDVDNIDGWTGDDLIFGFGGGDTLNGGAGDDMLVGDGGGDTLNGGADRDIAVFFGVRNEYTITEFRLGRGAMEYQVGYADGRENGGTDTLTNVEVLRFLGDNPVLPDDDAVGTSSLQVDIVRGSYDSDTIDAGDRAHTIDGGAGADTIVGGAGTQTITGGVGADMISGGGGDDVIQGGKDNDTLYGGTDANGATVGTDRDTAVYVDNFDGYHISAERITVGVEVTARFTVLDIRGAGADDEGEDTAVGFEVFRFGDGDREVVAPGGSTGAGDIIVGTNAGEIIDGGGGDDVIFGFGGGDTLNGGVGDDKLMVGGAGDSLDGGADRDIALFHDSRSDYTITEVRMIGGGFGYEVSYADGRDNGGTVSLTNIEVLRFLGDDPSNPDDDIVGTSSLRVEAISGSSDPDNIVSGDNAHTIHGGAGADTITGGGGEDTITGGVGDDDIQGGEGNDKLFGGSATSGIAIGTDNDTVVYSDDFEGYHFSAYLITEGGEEAAHFTVLDIRGAVAGDEGTDTVFGFEVFRFADGDRRLVPVGGATGSSEIVVGTNSGENIDGGDGDDLIFGFGGGDTLIGGVGNDLLTVGGLGDSLDGGVGRDFAVFLGDRNDYTITEVRLAGAGIEHEVRYADGRGKGGTVALANIEVLRFLGDDPALPDDDTVGASSLRVDIVRGSSDPDVIVAGVGARAIEGGAGADTIIGGAGTQTITGGGGADNISGGSGDDVIQGGEDDDTLYGGSDADGVAIGTDNDTVVYLDEFVGYHIWAEWITVGGAETARFTVLDIRGSGAEDEGEDTAVGFEEFRFGDGDRRVVTAGGTTGAGDIIVGTKSSETIDGEGGEDLIFGFGGGDTLNGGDGEDIIMGGVGGDTLDGGADRDIAVFLGDRNDYTITEVRLGRGAIEHRVGYADGRNNGGTDTLTNIEVFRFLGDDPSSPDDDTVGTSTLLADVIRGGHNSEIIEAGDRTHTIVGGAGADTITGGGGTQTIIGGGGADTIAGGTGDDRIYGNLMDDHTAARNEIDTAVFAGAAAGYSVTAVLGGSAPELNGIVTYTVQDIDAAQNGDDGRDIAVGFEAFQFGSDRLAVVRADRATGNGVSEIVIGSLGADTNATAIHGGMGDDLIFGFGGGDTITGGEDDDTIMGGDGDDVIDGGTGTMDIAVFRGDRMDYKITAVLGADGNPARYKVTDEMARNHGDDGEDTLTGVEALRFIGGSPEVPSVVSVGITVADAIMGTSGADTITGVDVAHEIAGGEESDVITGGGGDDLIDGGGGLDTAVYTGSWQGGRYEIHLGRWKGTGPELLTVRDTRTGSAGEGEDTLRNIETIRFSNKNFSVFNRVEDYSTAASHDIVIGDEGKPNSISGGGGDDILFGRRHNDYLYGGEGDDTLFGGGGDNVFYGNINTEIGSGFDIVDYGRDRTLSDTISTSRISFGGGTETRVSIRNDATRDWLVDIDQIRFGNERIDVSDLPYVADGADTGRSVVGNDLLDPISLRDLFGGDGEFSYEASVDGGVTYFDGGRIDDSGLMFLSSSTEIGGFPTIAVELVIRATHDNTKVNGLPGVQATHNYSITKVNAAPELVHSLRNIFIESGITIENLDISDSFGDDENDDLHFAVVGAPGLPFGLSISEEGRISGRMTGTKGVEDITIRATQRPPAPSAHVDADFDVEVIKAGAEIYGTDGDDLMVNRVSTSSTNRNGDDLIHGGDGNRDTVVYLGTRDDYRITRSGDAWILEDKTDDTNAGQIDEGRDTLIDVEYLRFGGFGGTDQSLGTEIVADFRSNAVLREPAAMGGSTSSGLKLNPGGEWANPGLGAANWFSSDAPIEYSMRVHGGGNDLEIDGSTGVIRGMSAPALFRGRPETFTLKVTASNVDDATWDDLVHTHTLHVENVNLPVVLRKAADTDEQSLTARTNLVFAADSVVKFDFDNWFTDPNLGDISTYSSTGFDQINLGSVDSQGVLGGTAASVGRGFASLTVVDGGSSEVTLTRQLTFDVVDSSSALVGGAADDLIFNRPGNKTIDGGAGTDTVSFAGDIEDYTFSLPGNDIVVTDAADDVDEGATTLRNIELIVFGDGTEILMNPILGRRKGDFTDFSTGIKIVPDNYDDHLFNRINDPDSNNYTVVFAGATTPEHINAWSARNSNDIFQILNVSDSLPITFDDGDKTAGIYISNFHTSYDRIALADIPGLQNLSVSVAPENRRQADDFFVTSGNSDFKLDLDTVRGDNSEYQILSRIYYIGSGETAAERQGEVRERQNSRDFDFDPGEELFGGDPSVDFGQDRVGDFASTQFDRDQELEDGIFGHQVADDYFSSML